MDPEPEAAPVPPPPGDSGGEIEAAEAAAAANEASAVIDTDDDDHDDLEADEDDDDVEAVAGASTMLVTGGPAFEDRWEVVQVDFVDDPRQAVQRADALIGDVVDEIMRALATEREQLSGAWRDDESATTEDLRLAFQRYRTVFHRLLRT